MPASIASAAASGTNSRVSSSRRRSDHSAQPAIGHAGQANQLAVFRK
jgi:hypothetical protein